jgi:hypothetical protein
MQGLVRDVGGTLDAEVDRVWIGMKFDSAHLDPWPDRVLAMPARPRRSRPAPRMPCAREWIQIVRGKEPKTYSPLDAASS